MRQVLVVLALGSVLGTACWATAPAGAEQRAATDQKQAGPQEQAADDQQSGEASGDTGQAQANEEKPGPVKRLGRHLRDQLSSGCVNGVGQHCWDTSKDDSNKRSEAEQTPSKTSPPRSDEKADNNQGAGESSSKGTKIDLSPPVGEPAAPGLGVDESDVHEMKPWNPHKADKDVEVGDFYFKRGNYRAAESRYAEALYWQDNHAIATFHLAEAEEKLGKFTEARKHYEAYLRILPDGEFAVLSKQGLDRLKDKPGPPVRSSVTTPK